MKKKLLCTLLCLLLLCTLLPVTAMADDGTTTTTTATTLEETPFNYAYDAQRYPAYPKKNETVTLSLFKNPYGADGTQLTTSEGNWKLTKVGAYSTVDETIKSANSNKLTEVVNGLATQYSTSADSIIIHKLENDSTLIAYGVVVAYDSTNVRALFLGNNLAAANGGVGFILSKDAMSDTGSIVASIDITDIIKENTAPTVTMLDANGKPISSTNLPKAGDTLTAKVENAPEGKTLTYAWRISAESEANSSVVNNGITCTLKDDTAGQYISLRVTWADDGYAASGTFQIAAAEDNTPVDDPAPSTGHTPIRRQSAVTTTTADTDTTKADTVTSAKTFDAGIAVYAALGIMSMTGSAWIAGTKRRH